MTARRSIVSRALTTLAVILAIWIVGPRAAHAQTRIMPLGVSITGSPGCWRALRWRDLQNNGFTSIDFVGTLPPQGCGIPYDGDNEEVSEPGRTAVLCCSQIFYIRNRKQTGYVASW